jgi:hypothetical protein
MTAARTPRRPLLALAVVVLLLVGLVAAVLLAPYDPNVWRDPAGALAAICAFAAFGLVGALIIWQRPGNALGWVMAAIGLLAVWGVSADSYADYAYAAGQQADLLFLVSLWISFWYWFPLLGLSLIFTPLLFPDGRPPSQRWRPVVWAAGLALGLITFLAAFKERMEFQGIVMDNPVGIPGIADPEKSQLGAVLFGVFFVLLFAALTSVVVRYLRSGGVQRHQIKWLMFATLLAVLTMVSETFVEILENSEVLFAVSLILFPAAIAVAIFRYRLYDIDVIINRALVYGALTVSLVLVYLMGVAGVQMVFRLLTGQDQQPQLAVVASTLIIAALFNPLRRRIQATIDRRFYRRKYDARKTLDDFSIRLRDETDLEQLNFDLLSVVRETMQPAHASLWLRSPERVPGQEAEG